MRQPCKESTSTPFCIRSNNQLLVILIVFLLLGLSSAVHDPTTESSYPTPLTSFGLAREAGKVLDARDANRRRLAATADQTPLSWLMGSFFAYLYVGTPAQRVTVITDTGSHHTAFPCVGCACGSHMDSPFDPAKSKSAQVSRCGIGNGKCFIQQSYSEGSSWHAYEVEDRVWVGEESVSALPSVSKGLRGTAAAPLILGAREVVAANWSTPFKFGCQDRETGLFRTQEIDGIMGLSAHENTLPFVLHRAGTTSTKAFAMCMHSIGGVLTLGGVDMALHDEPVRWAALLNGRGVGKQGKKSKNGWFTVRLVDILMKPVDGGPAKSLGVGVQKLNAGKGAIVDSGTTDTYLPADISLQFNTLFSEMSGGMRYNNRMQDMSDEDFGRLPTFIYRLEAADGQGTVDVESLPSSYTETVTLPNGKVRRTHRVYTTEGTGTVLGSNFMMGHNTIFDIDAGKIGFAPSKCRYSHRADAGQVTPVSIVRGDGSAMKQDMIAPWEASHYTQALKTDASLAPASQSRIAMDNNFGLGDALPEDAPAALTYDFQREGTFAEHAKSTLGECGETVSVLQTACTARCPVESTSSVAVGYASGSLVEGQQTWVPKPCKASGDIVPETQKCSFYCRAAAMSRGSASTCLQQEWSECKSDCTQSRLALGPDTSVWGGWKAVDAVFEFFRGSENTCVRHLETRSCNVFRCPSQDGDWSVTAELHVRTVSAKEWSPTHTAELLRAVSTAIRIPDSFMHLTTLRAQESKSESAEQVEIRGQLKVRLPYEHYLEVTDVIAKRAHDALEHADLPLMISRIGSPRLLGAASTPEGEGQWLLPSTVSIHGAAVVKLQAPATHKIVTAASAVTGSGLSSAYMHPSKWTKQTYRRIAGVVCLQLLAISLFFLLRRVRDIHNVPAPTRFDAYKGTEQTGRRLASDTDSGSSMTSPVLEDKTRRKKGRTTTII